MTTYWSGAGMQPGVMVEVAPLVKYRGAQDPRNASTVPEGDTHPIDYGWWCPKLGLAHFDHVDVALRDPGGLEITRPLMRDLVSWGVEWLEAAGPTTTRRININAARTVAELVHDVVHHREYVVIGWRAWMLLAPGAPKLEAEPVKQKGRRRVADAPSDELRLI